jgi:hydrogenase expression/formation protein HypC
MCLAVPGRIISLTDSNDQFARKGMVDFAGITKEISLAYVPEAALNDYVIVHAGLAISVLDEADAQASLLAFEQFSESEQSG